MEVTLEDPEVISEWKNKTKRDDKLDAVLEEFIYNMLSRKIPKSKILFNEELPKHYLAEYENFNSIPLMDLEGAILFTFPPTFTVDAKVTKAETEKLLKKGYDQIWVDTCISAIKQIVSSPSNAGKKSDHFTLWWRDSEKYPPPKPRTTTVKTKKGNFDIHSICTQIPVKEEQIDQYDYFESVMAHMIQELILQQKIKLSQRTTINYAYFISNTVKLNLFISFQ